MGSRSPIPGGLTSAVSKAIEDLLSQARASGVRVIDVHREAANLRSRLPEASGISADELAKVIISRGSDFGLEL